MSPSCNSLCILLLAAMVPWPRAGGQPPAPPRHLRQGQEGRNLQDSPCGCASCTPAELSRIACDSAGCYSCGSRIGWLQSSDGGSLPEAEACGRVATEFPAECGACDPTKCDMPCGCDTCTGSVLGSVACDGGGCYSCESRMDWLRSAAGGTMSEPAACGRVGTEFPGECGGCDPTKCADPGTSVPTPAPSSGPTGTPTGSPTGPPTGLPTQRPTPRPTVPPTLSPTDGPTPAPGPPPPGPSPCGCQSCTASVLAAPACDGGGCYSCRSRMDWLRSPEGGSLSEEAACGRVGSEFPAECGSCDSTTCGPAGGAPTAVPTAVPTPDPAPPPSGGPFPCGCQSCTSSVLAAPACDGGGCYSCGSRMDWLRSPEGGSLSEEAACGRVGSEFVQECGSCDPTACDPTYVDPPDPSHLVWSDEFDGPGRSLPDPARWTYDVGTGNWGWGNGELQYYTEADPANASVEGGILSIRAVRREKDGTEYTSARLVTRELGDWTYGRFLIRARLDRCTGLGTWPAIWMLPTDRTYGGWPSSGEIDIMEMVGYEPGMVHGTVHTEAYNHGLGTQVGSRTAVELEGWHVYEVMWTPNRVDFVVDGRKYHEFARVAGGTYREWPFDRRFHLLLNVAVGGQWGGAMGVDPGAFEGDGQVMEVDWVRVYSQ